MSGAASVFWIFAAIWLVLIASGYVIFFRKRDASFKKRWYPRLTVFALALLIAFAALAYNV